MTKLSSAADRVDSADALDRALRIVRLHCDPRSGARYWIEKAAERKIDVSEDLEGWEDLLRFGWMDEEAMRSRPIDDFVPALVPCAEPAMLLGETSALTGLPKTAIFTPSEFEEAFIEPFDPAARAAGFPSSGSWLWIGPSGPHSIGQAAREIARRRSGRDPFSVDFDPRWFNKLAAHSFARRRYLGHLIDQAIHIIERESIEILFTTPSVLEPLAERMTPEARERITGVHYGGQALGRDRSQRLRAELFPGAVHLSGYGNSLFGVSMQIGTTDPDRPRYFPFGKRLRIRIIDPEAHIEKPPSEWAEAAPGERGRVVFNRFDRSMMILNLLERDEAGRVVLGAGSQLPGFATEGIECPEPSRAMRAPKAEGIY